ncbi:MAG: hypothetical protein ACUVQ1_00960 [Candidatus Kapaibacteriales bacterium]
MAKKEEKIETNGGEPIATEPMKPQSSGFGLIPILGIVFGSLLLLIIATRFIFLPYIVESLKDDKKKEEVVKKDERSITEKGPYAGIDKKLIKYVESGRITTNPFNSADQFVVVNLGFKFYATNEETLKEMFGEKGGEGLPTFPPEFMGKIRSRVNQILGAMTIPELQQKRLEIANIFKDSLKTIFSANNLILGEVFLQEFIIQ